MAGAGWRRFQPGEVLTATNLQSYGIDQSVQVYAGTAARGSAIGTAVSEGMTTYLKDSDLIEVYDGTTWRAHTGGLVPLRPTTVTAVSGSATVSASGAITVTNVNGVLIDGVFSSKYRNYIIECEINGGTNLGLQFRTGGVSNSTSNYSTSGFYTPGNSINYNNQQYLTYMQVGWANLGHVSLKISSPAHDKATNVVSQEDGYDGGTDRAHHTALAGFFGPTTLFDGLRLYGLSNVISGTISIYGMVE